MSPAAAHNEPPAPRSDPVRTALDRITEAQVAVTHAAPSARAVALTFDDGPGPQTMDIVRTLGRLHAHATFFVIGRQVDDEPQALRAAQEGGNAIGIHTWSHPDLRTLPGAGIREQVAWTRNAIRRVTGVPPMVLRPPYGGIDRRVLAVLAPFDVATVLWDVDTGDYRRPGTDAIVRAVLGRAHPGAIILLHDGGGDRTETVAALPAIVTGLRGAGYRLMTVPQLLAAAPPSGSALTSARAATGP